MRCYTGQHRFYAGIDLHARSMFIHILDQKGKTVFAKDLPAEPQAFLDAMKPFRDGLVVGVECMFAWYWLADLCEDHSIPFVLGHALYMRMIHGGKAKTDKIDAAKLASMLRGGLFPMAYVCPRDKRQTRELLRRRSFFVRQRAQLITHFQNTNTQFNRPPLAKKLTYAANRSPEIAERFPHLSTRLSITADLVPELHATYAVSSPAILPGVRRRWRTSGPTHSIWRTWKQVLAGLVCQSGRPGVRQLERDGPLGRKTVANSLLRNQMPRLGGVLFDLAAQARHENP